MSEIAYSELTAAVIGIMEIDNTDADRFNVDINLAIAQQGLLNVLPSRFLKNAIKTVKGDLSNGVSLYQWPDDFFRRLNVWADYSAEISESNPGAKCIPYDPDEHVLPIQDLGSITYPFIDMDVEGGFGLYPVPSSDQTNGLRIRYVWKLPNPASTQPCLLNYDLKNLMVFKTVQLCALVEEFNIELSREYGRLYDDELAKFLPKKEKK